VTLSPSGGPDTIETPTRAPNVAQKVIDWAIQAHSGGVCDDYPLAYMYAWNRTLWLADGPDEVHRNAIAKWEIGRHVPIPRKP